MAIDVKRALKPRITYLDAPTILSLLTTFIGGALGAGVPSFLLISTHLCLLIHVLSCYRKYEYTVNAVLVGQTPYFCSLLYKMHCQHTYLSAYLYYRIIVLSQIRLAEVWR
jgi:hypothetical protein